MAGRIEEFLAPVLSWDIGNIAKIAGKWSARRHHSLKFISKPKKVQDNYRDEEYYFETYKALLLEDVKHYIVAQWWKQHSTRPRRSQTYDSKIVKREVRGGRVLLGVSRVQDFSFSSYDLLWIFVPELSCDAFALVDDSKVEGEIDDGGFAVIWLMMFNISSKDKLYKKIRYAVSAKHCDRLKALNKVTPGSILSFKKICNLTRFIREFNALGSISTLPLKDLILSPSKGRDMTQAKYMDEVTNDINVDLSSIAFVLIQAPPGTKKTETVSEIIRRAFESNDGTSSSVDYSSMASTSRKNDQAPRVLVCAPSKSTLEEILLQLKEDGCPPHKLEDACIVLSTLGDSGLSVDFQRKKFDVVIICDATQVVEPATLVPLVESNCGYAFLIGDPAQLSAEVSPMAKLYGYDKSLFERFQRAGYPVYMLETQYRMHPEISNFPSKEFYNEELKDEPKITQQTTREWHKHRCFGPFCFFNIQEEEESQASGCNCKLRVNEDDVVDLSTLFTGCNCESRVNEDEVEFAYLLHKHLTIRFPKLNSSSEVAILSPYNDQVELFKKKFKDSNEIVHIDTINGFQGKQKDVVILSCVRANDPIPRLVPESRSLRFLPNARQINVGITGARSSLLVIGSASRLRSDEHWARLIKSAEDRNCFFQVRKPFAYFFSFQKLHLRNEDGGLITSFGGIRHPIFADGGLPDDYGLPDPDEDDYGD